MPALVATEFVGEVEWLGVVEDRKAQLASVARTALDLEWTGVVGESHGGLTRPSCARVLTQYPQRGTEIRNTRQVSILSAEELETIAAAIGAPGLTPDLLGASIVLRGIPDFTHVPPSARLQNELGTTLCVDMENHPCRLPAKGIAARFGVETGRAFQQAAKDKRGVTAWVERIGPLRLGDKMRLHIPKQRGWTP